MTVKKKRPFPSATAHFLVGFFLASSIPLIKSWPYRWLRQVWHQRSQHMGPSWKLGKPCRARRPGLFRLQTQILCVARNSLGTDFKSSRRKRPTNICYHVDHVDLCHGWRSFLGSKFVKSRKQFERVSATMNVQFLAILWCQNKKSSWASIGATSTLAAWCFHPSSQSDLFIGVFPVIQNTLKCSLHHSQVWSFPSQMLPNHARPWDQRFSISIQETERRSIPVWEKALKWILGTKQVSLFIHQSHGFFVGCLEISRL